MCKGDGTLYRRKIKLRSPVAVRKHKEPTELDFHTFFDVVDNRTRNEILKTGMPGQPPSLHIYSNDTKTTTSFFILTENPHDVTDIENQLLKKHHSEYDY